MARYADRSQPNGLEAAARFLANLGPDLLRNLHPVFGVDPFDSGSKLAQLMRNITNISNSRQASQGDEYRFMGQSYVAHMINVAIAICPSLKQAVEPGVGI